MKNATIKLFPMGSLKYTIFEEKDCLEFLRSKRIELVLSIEDADIYLLRTFYLPEIERFQDFIQKNNIEAKPILIWTHEPRYAPTDYECIEIKDFCTIYIMNLYTHNVYFSNYTFFGKIIDGELKLMSDVSFSKVPTIGLASYVNPNTVGFILNNIDIDLSLKRQQLLLEGHHLRLIDVYGKNWPDSIAKSESRNGDWQYTKQALLQGYQFNIALENTSYNHYCTEKIWDSIKGYCLPIYSSFNNKIYDTFPKGSFIDYDDFSENRKLFDYLKKISKAEYLQRMNSCITVFNDLYQNVDFKVERQRAVLSLIEKVNQIYALHHH